MVGGIFLWCFVIAFVFLLFWFCIFICPVSGDWAYSIHSRWIELERHEFDLLNYCGMGLFKMLSFVLFLLPYIAIRLVVRRARKDLGY